MIQGPASLPALPALQRARGQGRIAVHADGGRTRLSRLYQDGCAKIRLPHDAAATGLEAVLINTAGGVTGGDRMDWVGDVGAGARLTLTSQACEKVYRARDGSAELGATLTAGPGARLDWLPQETIVFDGGGVRRTLHAELDETATFLACEAVVLGRTAMDETVRYGEVRDRWRVRRGGQLIFADDLRLSGAISEIAASTAALGGARAFASLLLVDREPERFLTPVRAALGVNGGASAFDGRLFARVTASDGFELRRVLVPALEILRDGAPLPRVWRL
ncbi:MAG: urease accessory protein UreD [Phenylobacterium sp.]|nr:urease accessory protein UreD [Phenylobacterium sp.]